MKADQLRSIALICCCSLLLLALAERVLRTSLSGWNFYNPTPLHALSEWPGHLPAEDLDSRYIWQQQEVAGGFVYLYYYPLNDPNVPERTYCVGTTFVTPENWLGWRAQSGNKIGCWQAQETDNSFSAADITGGHVTPVRLPYNSFSLPASEFMASATIGGNVTPLTTAYGLAGRGTQVRTLWDDGHVSYTPVKNGTFLQTYPAYLRPTQFELIDEQGITLAIQSITR